MLTMLSSRQVLRKDQRQVWTCEPWLNLCVRLYRRIRAHPRVLPPNRLVLAGWAAGAEGLAPNRFVVDAGAAVVAGVLVEGVVEAPNPPNKLPAGLGASEAGAAAEAPNENPPETGAGATLFAGAADPNSPPGVDAPDPGALFDAEPAAAGFAPNPANPKPPDMPPVDPNAGAAPNAGAGGLVCGVVDPVAGAAVVEELPNEKAATNGKRKRYD